MITYQQANVKPIIKIIGADWQVIGAEGCVRERRPPSHRQAAEDAEGQGPKGSTPILQILQFYRGLCVIMGAVIPIGESIGIW
jgi:hypothetical protein